MHLLLSICAACSEPLTSKLEDWFGPVQCTRDAEAQGRALELSQPSLQQKLLGVLVAVQDDIQLGGPARICQLHDISYHLTHTRCMPFEVLCQGRGCRTPNLGSFVCFHLQTNIW